MGPRPGMDGGMMDGPMGMGMMDGPMGDGMMVLPAFSNLMKAESWISVLWGFVH